MLAQHIVCMYNGDFNQCSTIMHPAINEQMKKYPSTPHVYGSRLQNGDDESTQTPYKNLKGKFIVIEEKKDGANSGFSFTDAGDLRLQSRGHFLLGGSRESQFGMFKSWVTHNESLFLERFEDRYIVYGEWMYEKHTIFYDNLPHLFLEFDIWDKQDARFLSTAQRRALCKDLPIVSVPVLYEGIAPKKYADVMDLVGPSSSKTANWEATLFDITQALNMDWERVKKQTLRHQGMEGLYIKVEDDTDTLERYKWVRPDFTQAILDGDGHHQHRMLVPNKLNPNVQLFEYQSSWDCSP